MVGEDLYNRAHGKEQDLKATIAEKLSQSHTGSEKVEDPASEEQKVTLSHKSPSLGKRR